MEIAIVLLTELTSVLGKVLKEGVTILREIALQEIKKEGGTQNVIYVGSSIMLGIMLCIIMLVITLYYWLKKPTIIFPQPQPKPKSKRNGPQRPDNPIPKNINKKNQYLAYHKKNATKITVKHLKYFCWEQDIHGYGDKRKHEIHELLQNKLK